MADRLTAIRGDGIGRLVKKVKGLIKKNKNKSDTENSMVITREKVGGRGGRSE